MATREQKRNKQKLAKQKQKENREKNKDFIENYGNEIDFNNLTKFDGIRAYVLIKLKEIIHHLNSGENDDEKIKEIATELRNFAEEPVILYQSYIYKHRNEVSKEQFLLIKNLLREPKYNLNSTERALMKSQGIHILCVYVMTNTAYENIDYGEIKVFFELLYQAILIGLEENKISSLRLNVGYGDCLVNFEVEYEDNSEKYNPKDYNRIYMCWNSLDNLYTKYSVYKTKYLNFEESSLKSLATAYEIEEEYRNRETGKELISYNGIALNYVSVFEVELKKLISKNFNISQEKLKLYDAIEYLRENNFEFLSQEEYIDKLHQLRNIRNHVAHGYSINYEELQNIKKLLINEQILQFISWNLTTTERVQKYIEENNL